MRLICELLQHPDEGCGKKLKTDDILEVMTFLKKNIPWQDKWTVIDRKHPYVLVNETLW